MVRPRYIHDSLVRRLGLLVRTRLWLQVLIAIGTGSALGVALGPDAGLVGREAADLLGAWLALPGQLFLALIGMVIVPLASSSIVLGIAGTGGGDALKSVGLRLGVFVVTTTLAAAGLGIVLAKAIRPGSAIGHPQPALPPPGSVPDGSAPDLTAALEEMTRELPALLTRLIPQNITQALLERDVLAVVIFAVFIGIAVVNADRKELTRPIVALAQAVLEVSMTVIRYAMLFAPVAVFGLIANTVMTNGLRTLVDLGVYCAVVLAGLALLLVMYLVIVLVAGRQSPWAFARAVWPVQLLAFSTSSSAAVMPLTMKTAIEQLGVSPAIAGAVVPLASTVNMAGTALYQSAAIVFLAQSAGTYMPVGDLVLMMITLTGASIGAPAAPGASIAILSATAASFGVPLVGLPLILGVDRILDMARTAVNVTGDLAACRVLQARGQSAQSEQAPADGGDSTQGAQSADGAQSDGAELAEAFTATP